MIRLATDKVAWLFGYRGVPYAARGIFRHELIHMQAWGFVWGSLNAHFCGYVAIRSFQASDFLVSVITASMAFANLFAVWWAALAQRTSKRSLLQGLFAAISLLLMSVALTQPSATAQQDTPWLWAQLCSPTHPIAAAIFGIQIVTAWLLAQGINTIRTSIWKVNYPDDTRARILARFAIWQILTGSAFVSVMGAYLDGAFVIPGFGDAPIAEFDLSWIPGASRSDSYRFAFPMAGAAGLVSLYLFRHMHIRGDDAVATNTPVQREGTENADACYATPGWFSTRWGVLRLGLIDSLSILRQDTYFRHYMCWMFLSGSAVMMVHVPLLFILNDVFDLNYLNAAGLLTLLPQIVLIVWTPLWAKRFDHWPLFYFRAIQISVWGFSRLLLAGGVYWQSMTLVVLAVILSGVALAGGRFAWQLGHMSFSNKTNDATYLGINQTLTGIRGLVLPLLGAVLYRYVLDWHIVWITGILLFVSVAGYVSMHRATRNTLGT